MSNRAKRQAWETREGATCSHPEATSPEEARKLWRQFLAEHAAELCFGEIGSAAWHLLDAADWRECCGSPRRQPWDRHEFLKSIAAARAFGPAPLP